MTDRIQAMRTFMRIVETNSFTRAAQSLDIPIAGATRIMQQLEATLGTQLLRRTTRRLSVTPEGAAYYERCAQILADVDELEASMRERRDNPVGRLRVEMPGVVATSVVLPALHDFHCRFPNIELVIGVSHRDVDLIAEAVDCSIQLGELADSSLAARRLGVLEQITCASPQYLQRKGIPHTLNDLSQHVAVQCMCGSDRRLAALDFNVDDVPVTVKINGFVAVSDEHAYMTSGLQGHGLIQPAAIAAKSFIESDRLLEVLAPWKPKPIPVSVLYVKGRHVSGRVRKFVDWLAELFNKKELFEADSSRCPQQIKQERCSA